jgi:uncharacterized protein (DUF362 family)/Pyruvate/2-oxoacid:ferredoxin oxidoreductase delta subunit
VRCEDYYSEAVCTAVGESLDLIGGMARFVSPGDKVLIKPNLLAAREPDKAVTTHPRVVEAVIELVKAAGGVPWVGESAGGVSYGFTSKAFEATGMAEVIDRTGAVLKNFEVEGITKVHNRNARIARDFYMAKPVLEADVVISVPKLKTHEQVLFTGAVKNMFGIVPGGGKRQIHYEAVKPEELCDALLDVYEVATPHLCVMDAVVGMEGAGPAMGRPREVGLVLAGADGIALDHVACTLIGFDPGAIGTTRLGMERGLGVASADQIDIVGEKPRKVLIEDFAKPANAAFERLPRWIVKRMVSGFQNIRPVVEEDSKCVHCLQCQNSCPVGAITVGENSVHLSEKKCVRCFCCRELCPEGVFGLKRSRLSQMLFKKVYT